MWYETYQCTACGHKWLIRREEKEPDVTACPKCYNSNTKSIEKETQQEKWPYE